jgi:hypothetical protein
MNEAKRTRKPASFTLEKIVELSEEAVVLIGEKFAITDVATGFVSPEKAIEFAVSKKIQGMLRVVRVVSPIFEGSVVTPEPVYSLKKIDEMCDDKPAKKKRKSKKQAVESFMAAVEKTVTTEALREEWSIPKEEDDEAAPVDDDIPPEDEAVPVEEEAIPTVDPAPF